MRSKITLRGAVAILLISITSSCAVHTAGNSGKVPPGQAKKISGKKSAKSHAPGQKKKN